MSRIFLYLLSTLLLLPVLPGNLTAAETAEIEGPKVKVSGNSIVVTTGLALDNAQLDGIKKGVRKEIVFYIDLFRVWDNWPDEFVLGKTFANAVKCDPVKKQFAASSLSGPDLKERRFGDCGPALEWALSIDDLKLTNISELEPDDYFVRVTVESRLRRLPPVISSLFFFVREKEFSLTKDSAPFKLKALSK